MTTAALAEAAEKLRHLSRAAIGSCRPWRYAKGQPNDSVRTETGWEVAHGDDPNNLRYIAAMHPGVGLALADWLGCLAMHEPAERSGGKCAWCGSNHAEIVARALTALPSV